MSDTRKKIKEPLTPTQIITLGFLALVLLGAFILYMPISYTGQSPSIIDCIFTATSAVCVTGLVVLDTATTWTFFGQAWILGLIQIGGIGFMTLIAVILTSLKRKVSYSNKLIVKESLSQDTMLSIIALVKRIVKITLIIEAIGAIALSIYFIPTLGINKGVWYSIFHSVSAFCNAGFDLMGNISGEFSSITLLRDNIYINIILGTLIVLGGIGFHVIKDIYDNKNFSKLTLHSKIVIIATLVLIIGGALSFFLLEYNNPYTIGTLSITEKINVSLFQSITTRTAGFNTIELSNLRTSTMLIMLILMAIGASPASTGGGIKTTAITVVLIYLKNSILGIEDNNCFKKRIPRIIVKKSIVAVILASTLSLLITLILTIFEPNIDLISALFESISSLATVGLSLGVTSTLTPLSKILLAISMFLGRVGAITVIFALSSKLVNTTSRYKYTEENILI